MIFENNLQLIDKCISILYNRKKSTFNGCNTYYEDVKQNCYIDVYKSLLKYDNEKSKIESFIYSMVDNSIKDQIRNINREKRKINFMTNSMEDYYDKGVNYENDIELRDLILKILTPKEIKVISYLEKDYNTVQIGEIMGYTPANIRAIRDKAREKIREYIYHN